MTATIRVPRSRQGQLGVAQGGWISHAFVTAIGEPSATVALRRPVPLETDLDVVADGDRWLLVDPSAGGEVLLEATRWEPDYPTTAPVALDRAEAARATFAVAADDHPAVHCISCGLGPDSLRVHPGPIGEGRWATPWRVPAWGAVGAGRGTIDESLLWMAMDCSTAWYISLDGPDARHAVTVQLAVTTHDEIRVETDYTLVAWAGDHTPRWDGRKRGAASALFDTDGRCVASSRSFWVAV